MRGVKVTLAVAVVACGLVLAGCGGSRDTPRPVPRSATSAASTAMPPTSAAPSSPAAIPSPDDEQRLVLITKLQQIDAGLVADADGAVNYGRNVCQYLRAGGATEAQGYAVSRATADGVTLSDAQGADVVAAVQTAFCS